MKVRGLRPHFGRHSVIAEIEAALEHKDKSTKTYFRSHIALLEQYVALMNANNRNLEVWIALQKELSEKGKAMRDAYVEEMEKKGLASEVGFPRCEKAIAPSTPIDA
jgi:hypothetical protein